MQTGFGRVCGAAKRTRFQDGHSMTRLRKSEYHSRWPSASVAGRVLCGREFQSGGREVMPKPRWSQRPLPLSLRLSYEKLRVQIAFGAWPPVAVAQALDRRRICTNEPQKASDAWMMLMAATVVAAIVIQHSLPSFGVASIHTDFVSPNTIATDSVIVFHWRYAVPLAAAFAVGLICSAWPTPQAPRISS